MNAVITLTTDFGLADSYVATMKGVILGINPDVTLVDISHTVSPQDIHDAAFILSTACDYFPPRTIHLVVTDPGVGTNRRAVILRTPVYDFVAPDNGVLSFVLEPFIDRMDKNGRAGLRSVTGMKACTIEEPRYWRTPVSPTFHGRDIFAPVAAHLSLGVPPDAFGKPVDSLQTFTLPHPSSLPDGVISAEILHVDGFGNLVVGIKASDLPEDTTKLTIEVGGVIIRGLTSTYGTSEGLLALIGSSDYLEIALKNGNAAAVLGLQVGDNVIIRC
jgi:S-adenosylmethionine hydrolase